MSRFSYWIYFINIFSRKGATSTVNMFAQSPWANILYSYKIDNLRIFKNYTTSLDYASRHFWDLHNLKKSTNGRAPNCTSCLRKRFVQKRIAVDGAPMNRLKLSWVGITVSFVYLLQAAFQNWLFFSFKLILPC